MSATGGMSRTEPQPYRQSASLLSETASAALLAGAVFFAVLSAFFLAGVILRLGATPDLPWLKAAGHWILDHGQLPATDPFSWTAAERPWVLYQWGFEAALAALDRVAGHAGVAVAFAWAALVLARTFTLRSVLAKGRQGNRYPERRGARADAPFARIRRRRANGLGPFALDRPKHVAE